MSFAGKLLLVFQTLYKMHLLVIWRRYGLFYDQEYDKLGIYRNIAI